jgi:hypothetical protein
MPHVHAADWCLYRQACVRAHECACVRKPVRSRTGNVPRSNNALCGPTPHRGSRRSVSLGLSRPPIGMGVVFAWPHRDEWRGWRPSRSYPRTVGSMDSCRSRMPRRYRIARAPDARRWIPVCLLFQGRQPWRASAAWKFKNHRRHGPKQTQSESASACIRYLSGSGYTGKDSARIDAPAKCDVPQRPKKAILGCSSYGRMCWTRV